MTVRTRLLAAALLLPLAVGCRGLGDLEPRARDPLPTKVGKVVVLIPVCVVGFCVLVVAAAAQEHGDGTEATPRARHPDYAPGKLQQLF